MDQYSQGVSTSSRDLPGIIEGAADGRGRGKQVIATARTCNLILIVLDAGKPITHKKIIENELNSFGIRVNQKVCMLFSLGPRESHFRIAAGSHVYQEGEWRHWISGDGKTNKRNECGSMPFSL